MREAAHIVMHTYVHNMHAHFCTQCDNRGAAFCLSPNACSMAQHLWVQQFSKSDVFVESAIEKQIVPR